MACLALGAYINASLVLDYWCSFCFHRFAFGISALLAGTAKRGLSVAVNMAKFKGFKRTVGVPIHKYQIYSKCVFEGGFSGRFNDNLKKKINQLKLDW